MSPYVDYNPVQTSVRQIPLHKLELETYIEPWYMQEVVDSAGLENEEIKYHYEEIRKCIDDIR